MLSDTLTVSFAPSARMRFASPLTVMVELIDTGSGPSTTYQPVSRVVVLDVIGVHVALAGLPVRLLCAPELGCLEVKVERACLPSD